MISKINSIILFINISQSLLININNVYNIQFSTYVIVIYEMIIFLSFTYYIYYERKEYLKNEKYKNIFKEMNELNRKYIDEIKNIKNKTNYNKTGKTDSKYNKNNLQELNKKNINRSVSDPNQYNKIYNGINYKQRLIKNYFYDFKNKKLSLINNYNPNQIKNSDNLKIVKL